MKIMFGLTFLNDPDREEERKYWKKQLMSNHRIGITRAVVGVTDRKGVYEELGNIKCPTLILVGDEDVTTVPARSERIHNAIIGLYLAFLLSIGLIVLGVVRDKEALPILFFIFISPNLYYLVYSLPN